LKPDFSRIQQETGGLVKEINSVLDVEIKTMEKKPAAMGGYLNLLGRLPEKMVSKND